MLAPGARGPEARISVFMSAQIESLCNRGWQPYVGILDDRTSPVGVVRSVLRLRSEMRTSQAALVHALYGSVTALVGDLIKSGKPLVISFCGDDLLGTPVDGWRWRLREAGARWLGLFAGLFATCVIVKSDNLRAALPEALKQRAVILPNGVDVNHFRPRSQENCRRQLGWSLDDPIVLFNASVGSNTAVKNPELARRTVELVRRTHGQVRLRTLSGFSADEVALALNAADCLLVTSIHEGSPNIVKEAMASGLPVVSVPCGDVAERLRNVSPGGICPYNADALARAIVQVIRDGKRSNGPDAIRAQELTLDDVARRLSGLYAAILERRNASVISPSVQGVAVERTR